ncbi:MAG: C45 family autoproteolytic acyltransferase/hydrolase [Planctomycetota bacterium]|nr:C45 family autoproteolytic acyltransferase/hydrolase [Planctomycetota bacterium]MDA1213562.1 C45 family autoproteolytic acyltransferase/hydrolase [Planctomycetota bacterium]
MESILQCVSEVAPSEKWRSIFQHHWPAYRKWFLKEGDAARPTYLACERALRTFMPELIPTYEKLTELVGGGDLESRFLSLYRPTPYLTGCSQAVWTRGNPILVRNYDYSPKLWEAVLLHTAWNGRRVIAMSDCMWGVLDGINESGLSVSLAFGGRRVVGEGFGMPLILRYILEFCDSADDAVHILSRVPSHMAYNVTVLDGSGNHNTVFVSPDRPALVSRRQLATNHQHQIEWDEHARATATLDRAHFLTLRLDDDQETADRFVSRFLLPPLYQTNFKSGWGTLYTAVYRPLDRAMSVQWPHYSLSEQIDRFTETTLSISFDV